MICFEISLLTHQTCWDYQDISTYKLREAKLDFKLKLKMSDWGASSDKPGSVFNDLRLKGLFCDAVIKVEDVEFPIHKIILCQSSLYFRWVSNLIRGGRL